MRIFLIILSIVAIASNSNALYVKYSFCLHEIDSIENNYLSLNSDTQRIAELTDLAYMYRYFDKYKSKQLSDSAINIFYSIPYDISNYHKFKIAQCYRNSLMYETANIYNLELLNTNNNSTNSDLLVSVYIELAKTHSEFNNDIYNIDSAQYYFDKALTFVETDISNIIKFDLYDALTNFYYKIQDFEAAFKFSIKEQEIAKNIELHLRVLAKTKYIEILYQLNKLDEAEKLIKTSISNIEDKNLHILLPYFYYLGATILSDNNKYNDAVHMFQTAIKNAKEFDFNEHIAKNYLGIVKVYKNQNLSDSIFKYYYLHLEYIAKSRNYDKIFASYFKAADDFKLYGNSKEAIDLLRTCRIYKDSIWDFYGKIIVDVKEAQYAINAKKRDLEILKKEHEIQSAKINRIKYFVILLIFIIVLIIAIFSYLLQQRKIKSKQRISELMAQNLRQQMNPHFVFNTLNSIQYYLFQNDKKSSNIYLSKFAHLLRLVIDNSEKHFVSLNDEIQALELYLELEKLRFKEKISYIININNLNNIRSIGIPPMLIQPYVENAIIHGLMPSDKKGEIKIELKLNTEILYCSIQDNGIGRKKSEELKKSKNKNHQSLGTKITENRIKLLSAIHKDNLQIKFNDLTDDEGNNIGTKVDLNIPVKNITINGQTS
jgi:Histidine kinase